MTDLAAVGQPPLLLAHCGWPTDETYTQMVPETVAVIEAFLDGAPINVENPPVGASTSRDGA
jgi:lactate dehydrogenase-like 2-hydroxyacid dehydrogenase